jgi:hypothetical protein
VSKLSSVEVAMVGGPRDGSSAVASAGTAAGLPVSVEASGVVYRLAWQTRGRAGRVWRMWLRAVRVTLAGRGGVCRIMCFRFFRTPTCACLGWA